MKAISQLAGVLVAAAALAGCQGSISVKLSGAEQVPPLTVPGTGAGSLRVADDGTITGSITTERVRGTVAHIHQGAKGTNGPVIVQLDKSGDTYSVPPKHRLTPAQIEELKKGNLYVNVHTSRYRAGEVRGQIIIPECKSE